MQLHPVKHVGEERKRHRLIEICAVFAIDDRRPRLVKQRRSPHAQERFGFLGKQGMSARTLGRLRRIPAHDARRIFAAKGDQTIAQRDSRAGVLIGDAMLFERKAGRRPRGNRRRFEHEERVAFAMKDEHIVYWKRAGVAKDVVAEMPLGSAR